MKKIIDGLVKSIEGLTDTSRIIMNSLDALAQHSKIVRLKISELEERIKELEKK